MAQTSTSSSATMSDTDTQKTEEQPEARQPNPAQVDLPTALKAAEDLLQAIKQTAGKNPPSPASDKTERLMS